MAPNLPFDHLHQTAEGAVASTVERSRCALCPDPEILRLRAALEQARIPHLDCEGDFWYSCHALRDEAYWLPEDRQCTCGADEHNARIDAALNGSH